MNDTLKLKRVRVTRQATAGIELGEMGTAEVLPIDEIIVDPDYQRDLRHAFLAEIAEDFDIVKAGPILVSRRDGKLWCVDGQHRMLGGQRAGETEVLAHVVHGLTQQEEAELRLARNHRKQDSVQEKFRTRLVMGDEVAHAVVNVAKQHGTQINLETNMHKGINAIVAAETLYRAGSGNGEWLNRVLKFLAEAFDEDLNGRNVSLAMLKASAWFIDRHMGVGEASWKEMADRVGRVGVADIDRKARAHQAGLGGSLWLNYYRAFVEVWNHGRKDANKLMWKTQGSIMALGDTSSSRVGKEETSKRGS